MDAKRSVHALEQPLVDRALGAAAALLRWLEEEPDADVVAGPGACSCLLSERLAGQEQARHMGVVAAGVHEAGALRGIGQAGGLRDGQAVHIRAEEDRAGRARWAEVRDPARAGDGPGIAEDAEGLRNERAGALLRETELRDPVQSAPEGHEALRGGGHHRCAASSPGSSLVSSWASSTASGS